MSSFRSSLFILSSLFSLYLGLPLSLLPGFLLSLVFLQHPPSNTLPPTLSLQHTSLQHPPSITHPPTSSIHHPPSNTLSPSPSFQHPPSNTLPPSPSLQHAPSNTKSSPVLPLWPHAPLTPQDQPVGCEAKSRTFLTILCPNFPLLVALDGGSSRNWRLLRPRLISPAITFFGVH